MRVCSAAAEWMERFTAWLVRNYWRNAEPWEDVQRAQQKLRPGNVYLRNTSFTPPDLSGEAGIRASRSCLLAVIGTRWPWPQNIRCGESPFRRSAVESTVTRSRMLARSPHARRRPISKPMNYPRASFLFVSDARFTTRTGGSWVRGDGG